MVVMTLKRITLVAGVVLVLLGLVGGLIDEYGLGTYALVNGGLYLWLVDRWDAITGWWSS
jgi:hypothetical protein